MKPVAVWFTLLFALSLPLRAEVMPANYIELETGQRSASPQLTLFFWYGCDACKQLAPALDGLSQQRPRLKVNLVPSQLRADWYWAAKAFYCAQQLPERASLQDALYGADWQAIDSHPELLNWFVAQGVAEEQIRPLIYSALINQQLDRDRSSSPTQLKGVPAIVVNQHYLVDASMAESAGELIELVEQLLRQDAMRLEEEQLLNSFSQENLSNVSNS